MSNPRIPRKSGQPANSKKHSDLYTDENPKGTIHGLGFKDVATSKASVSKIRNSSRSHAHKIQAAVAMEQRAREMGKTSEAAVYRKFINSMKKKTKEMNESEDYSQKDKIMNRAKPLHKHLYKSLHKKDTSGDVNEEKNGKCKAGYYYCYTDEKCKPIPKGFRVVGRAGYLRKENGHSVDDEPKNGNGNGNGNGSNGNGNGSNGNGNGGGVSESKSGDSSLRDWFGKSKSSDGKPGWVQLGGKYAGKPCAKQPGQTTKPKCGSSKMKRNLSKDEEQAAFRRKNAKDPNPNRSGKAINVKTEETVIEKAGEKDACYHKVKSRYSVWPSAYASGALVKCRKKGAANWGNSTKKEETEIGEACWKGYEKKGMKTMFGKRYPNCVKKTKKEDVEITDAYGETYAVIQDIVKPEPLKPTVSAIDYDTYDIDKMTEAVRLQAKTGNLVSTVFRFRSSTIMLKMFFPQISVPKKSDVQDQINKVYPGAKLQSYRVTDYEPGEPVLHAEGAAWTKKSGKNKEGGLNEKGRKSYEKENPGSDLKAPSKKVGNPRRASFCARMKGMKSKLTSAKTARDPDSRINKSLRKWNC